jgi:putative DNA-invertase from lambdoid prophage Rac
MQPLPGGRADLDISVSLTYSYRVSTAEQASNGDSLATQRQQVEGYAMMKVWQISEFFIDGGVSGSVPFAKRPEGKRLLETVEKGDVIITAKLDRAFRNTPMSVKAF